MYVDGVTLSILRLTGPELGERVCFSLASGLRGGLLRGLGIFGKGMAISGFTFGQVVGRGPSKDPALLRPVFEIAFIGFPWGGKGSLGVYRGNGDAGGEAKGELSAVELDLADLAELELLLEPLRVLRGRTTASCV